MKDKIFGVLQRIGRSFMLPIAILPVAGLFLGIGASFSNETMLRAYGLWSVMGEGTWIYTFFKVLNAAGQVVFDNLPLLFAMGVAIGMAKNEKAVAALAATVAFLVMHATIGALIESTGMGNSLEGATASVLGINSLQMGVFGGIIVGLGVAALHNKFYKIQLPQMLSFFGGTRFVPIISAAVYLLVGILMYFVWPYIQIAISTIGNLVRSSGYIGTFIYGTIERALIPFGLHHVFYMPFWQTDLGGTMNIGGQVVAGAQNIFFAQLGDPGTTNFSVDATRFMAGKFPFMIFGLPGAALAMYKCAKPNKKKVVGGLLLSAALTAMLTGITEPLEFTFLFVAPLLYVIHCVLAGLSFMLMHILNVTVGMTFSGGIIDWILFGVLQGTRTNWYMIAIVGIFYFAIYYFIFKYLIIKLDLKTPGRENDFEEPKLYTRADMNTKKEANAMIGSLTKEDRVSALITHGLGGANNISDIDCCATRLRVTVYDGKNVDESALKQSGAAGVIMKGNGVQIVYGPTVTVIKSNLDDFLVSPLAGRVDEIFDVAKSGGGTEPSLPQNKNSQSSDKLGSEIIINAPESGRIIKLSDVPDDVFAGGILGDGVAIEPKNGRILSPADGRVGAVFDTNHAIGIVADNGAELFIHVGIDTVKLKGKYYTCNLKKGDMIKAGDTLIEFDINAIKSEGYSVITPVIISNTDKYSKIETADKTGGRVNSGEPLLKLEQK